MCKIITFTDMKKINLKKHVNDIGNTLLKLESDGFGYAVQGKTGVFGEKCVAKHFRSRLNSRQELDYPFLKKTYSKFGSKSELDGPGIFHGRTSTNWLGLNNTHPMQEDEWHLVHNGVVTDHGLYYKPKTQNDSEHVLHRLIEGIDSVEANLSGYYAFTAIDPVGRLHVARDQCATLFMAWSGVYETFIIATTENLILKVNQMLEAKISPIEEIEDDMYLIFEGNKVVYSQTIAPRGFTKAESQHSQKSLGYKIVTDGSEKDVFIKSSEPVSEADLENRYESLSDKEWNDALNAIALNTGPKSDREALYYQYRYELDNMDASYTIWDEHDCKMSLQEWKKLDHISQEQCMIVRADGTVVDVDDRELKLRA